MQRGYVDTATLYYVTHADVKQFQQPTSTSYWMKKGLNEEGAVAKDKDSQ